MACLPLLVFSDGCSPDRAWRPHQERPASHRMMAPHRQTRRIASMMSTARLPVVNVHMMGTPDTRKAHHNIFDVVMGIRLAAQWTLFSSVIASCVVRENLAVLVHAVLDRDTVFTCTCLPGLRSTVTAPCFNLNGHATTWADSACARAIVEFPCVQCLLVCQHVSYSYMSSMVR